MTTHICRDFLTLPSSSSPCTNMYLLTMFLQHVMNYDIDSNVNYDINSSTYTLAYGQNASINIATGSEYIVYVPSGSYSQSITDNNRILALKSDLYPSHNSGLFRVLSTTSSFDGDVGFIIDYRSSEYPQSEINTISWRLYESENNVPIWKSGSNGSTGYNSSGIADNSRIMLTSPLGFNVRLCLESVQDRSGTIPSGFSITPGVGAVSNADYDRFEGCLNASIWYDSTSSIYRGLSVGLTPNVNVYEWETGQWRFTAFGDTDTSAVACVIQNVTFATGGNGFCAFGIPDDISSTTTKLIDKLFVIGYGTALPNLSWHSGFFQHGHSTGIAWSEYGYPAPCILSSYADIRNLNPHIRSLLLTDNPFLNATELIDVEILAATISSSVSFGNEQASQIACRRVGILPFFKQGRNNYQQWSLTPDKSWFHTLDGMFLKWDGPHLSGTLTGSSNALLIATSSFIDKTGVQFYELNPSMSDPITTRIITSIDKDANRFKKTYSYYRQQPQGIQAIKCGSNQSKP